MPQKFNSGYGSIYLPIPGTIGTRVGANSAGELLGNLTVTNLDDCTQDDDSAGTFVDETTDAGDAGANDVEVPDPFDTDDALYCGYGKRFCAIVSKVGTQGQGDDVTGEVQWEYYNGSIWVNLATSHELTDSSSGGSAGTDTYVTSFIPPTDWAKTAVDGGTSMYFVRLRATADDVYNTTQAKWTTVKCLPLNAGTGLRAQQGGVVDRIYSHAMTASGTADDTELLIINVTKGTGCHYTWTGGDVSDEDTSVTEFGGGAFRVSRGDELVVVCVQEDGSTEFAQGGLVLDLR